MKKILLLLYAAFFLHSCYRQEKSKCDFIWRDAQKIERCTVGDSEACFNVYDSITNVLREKYCTKNGLMQGAYLEYDSTGLMIQSGTYNAGKRHGTFIFPIHGNYLVRRIMDYKNGLKDGMTYYLNDKGDTTEYRYYREDVLYHLLINHDDGTMEEEFTLIFGKIPDTVVSNQKIILTCEFPPVQYRTVDRKCLKVYVDYSSAGKKLSPPRLPMLFGSDPVASWGFVIADPGPYLIYGAVFCVDDKDNKEELFKFNFDVFVKAK